MSAQQMRDLRQRRYAARVLIDGRLVSPHGRHGTDATYTNYGCRCVPCTEAVRLYQRGQRARRVRNALNRERRRIAGQLTASS